MKISMMKEQLAHGARNLDAFCAKMNDGLTAVAVMLGFLVMVMAIIRAEQITPDLFSPLPSDVQINASLGLM